MKNEKINAIRTEPIQFFSANSDYFFKAKHMTLTEALPPIFEDCALYIYVTGGEGTISINGLNFALSEGSVCMLNTYHVMELAPAEENSLSIVVIAQDTALMSYLGFRVLTPRESDALFYRCPVVKLTGENKTKFESVIARFEGEEAVNDEMSSRIKASLYGQMSRIINEARRYDKAVSSFEVPLGWNILVFITKFNSQNLTAEYVARNFGISVSAMNRELRKITTYNFNQLLTRARTNTVCSLIPLEGLSLRFIGSYIGFASENAFYRAFKTWRGMTPQEYRDIVPRQRWGYARDGIYDLPWSIINYICVNYRSAINIKSAAADLYVTENSINSTLKYYAGVNFQEQLSQHRLLYARALLLTTNLPICDVAEESGFGSLNTFCRIFKEKYGCTASDYRKENSTDG